MYILFDLGRNTDIKDIRTFAIRDWRRRSRRSRRRTLTTRYQKHHGGQLESTAEQSAQRPKRILF